MTIKKIRIDKTNYIVNDTIKIPMIDVNENHELYPHLQDFGINTKRPSIDQIFKKKSEKFEKAVESYLNAKARAKGYDNILSATTYGLVKGRFYQEGIRFAEWRTDVWDYCYTELDKVKQGLRSEPTIEEFLVELPKLNI